MNRADLLRLASPACAHPPRWTTFRGLIWLVGCGFACRRGAECAAVAFAFGERREAPRGLLASGSAVAARGTLAGLFSARAAVGAPTVRRCIPLPYFEAARELGVDEWRRGWASGSAVAVGFSLGMPACAVTPYAGAARRFAEGAS